MSTLAALTPKMRPPLLLILLPGLLFMTNGLDPRQSYTPVCWTRATFFSSMRDLTFSFGLRGGTVVIYTIDEAFFLFFSLSLKKGNVSSLPLQRLYYSLTVLLFLYSCPQQRFSSRWLTKYKGYKMGLGLCLLLAFLFSCYHHVVFSFWLCLPPT